MSNQQLIHLPFILMKTKNLKKKKKVVGIKEDGKEDKIVNLLSPPPLSFMRFDNGMYGLGVSSNIFWSTSVQFTPFGIL